MTGGWRIWLVLTLAVLTLLAFHLVAQIAGPNRSLIELIEIPRVFTS